MKKLEINIPIYDQKVEVFLADEISTIDEYVKDIYAVNLDATSADLRSASTYTLPNGIIIIGLLPGVIDKVICHECGHATFELSNILGINPIYEQETFCYIQEYLFDKITTWVHKND